MREGEGEEGLFDIAVLGVPFDTAVSYRPGARFGPRAIRAASARQTSFRGFNARAAINPYSRFCFLFLGDLLLSYYISKLPEVLSLAVLMR